VHIEGDEVRVGVGGGIPDGGGAMPTPDLEDMTGDLRRVDPPMKAAIRAAISAVRTGTS
jgi:hypothetical protein